MFQVWITRDFVFNVDMVLEGWMDLRFLGWNPGVDGRWVMSEMSYFYEECFDISEMLNDLVKGICIALVPTTHNLMTTQGTLHPRPRLSTLQTLNGCFPYP